MAPGGSRLLTIKSTAEFSCIADAPIRPGVMRRSRMRISRVSRGRGIVIGMPARRTAHTSTPSCATPAVETPQAKAWPTVGT